MKANRPEVRIAIPRELRTLCAAPPPPRTLHRPPPETLRDRPSFASPRTTSASCSPSWLGGTRKYTCAFATSAASRAHINVFVNDDHVRARAGLDTPLTAGDLVTILPAVSGG